MYMVEWPGPVLSLFLTCQFHALVHLVIEAEAGGIIRATFGALFALGIVLNVDPSGVSTVMDIRWHKSVLP